MSAQPPLPTFGPTDPDEPPRSEWSEPFSLRDRAGRGPWIAFVAILIGGIVIAAVILLGGREAEPTVTTSVADVVDDPVDHEGERVVLSGRIDELLTDRVVAIGSDRATDDLLVLIEPSALIGGYGLAPGAVPPPAVGRTYEVGDVLRFTGAIQPFDRDAMADELGLVLNEQLFAAWDDEPALVVERIDVATSGPFPVTRPGMSAG